VMIQCIIPSFSAMLQTETIFNDSFRYLRYSQRRTYSYNYNLNANCQNLQQNINMDNSNVNSQKLQQNTDIDNSAVNYKMWFRLLRCCLEGGCLEEDCSCRQTRCGGEGLDVNDDPFSQTRRMAKLCPLID
jgi:hypothetical protein